ncbi:glycosyltransferase WbuB [Flavobacterium branchiophilum]|uniref:Glycosyltransferase involved in cell wall biosynthesis n=1 Tax=Flavobacterium branchiophilum TaxID=55197 RepID=A0A543G7M8_9FLAO|nr:glycosyltransferase family 4 protein [Flavobacterium branchiophilum]OXA76012.1 glycosyltransferase WbuB [Flavobacterium branchiophilum] [Flavobacterium branchiophilum NBRC 15030 = ATCC 35035]TQM42090.1 glycosyltransferase involved in cell wall biosynthesis [Flavobacterium branchiophilum]GEM53863.1 glycosyltransferase WbuB [Flavobacterium branchiophilum NBRC 15030 = ATCC 35035]
MNILLLHQYFLEENDPGGSRWNEMSKVWIDQGHQVTVLAGMIHANGSEKMPEYKGKYFVEKQQGGVQVIRCHVSESYNTNFLGRLWGYFSFVFSSLYAGIFKTKGKFDCIVVTSPPLFIGISGYLLSRLKRIPFVFEIRDLWPESAIDTGVVTNGLIIKLAYWLEAFLYKKAKLINVLTPAFRTTLIAHKKVDPEKIIFIPNAADFTLSDGLLNSFDVAQFRKDNQLEGHFVITYVGAHGVANHLDQVLETGKLLEDTNILFLLIGQGMEKERLKKKAKDMNCINVKFIDSVPKSLVFKYILASDVGTSVLKRVETFKTVYSNKTFDYMACKKPILMAIDGVSRALVEEAQAGLFVEPERPKDFEAKIRFYIENPEILKKHGENGYEYAKNNFDRHVLAKKYLQLIELKIFNK